ncbi:MAG: lysylphosphatidylglycerol synthase domain-containing protein [Cyanobacteriota bacterium]|jgi:uncharacterized membrane protein YbhN (UPF0104 family)
MTSNPILSARALVARLRPQLPGGLSLWISLLSIGFVMAAMVSHGRQLAQLRPDLQGWLWLVLGLGCSLLSLLANGIAWVAILRWLGHPPLAEATVALHMATNVRKFLPGGIWHLVARLQMLRQQEPAPLADPLAAPLATGPALLAVLLDPLLAAAAALALVPLGGWQAGLAPLALVPLLLLRPRWLTPLLRRLERRRARRLGVDIDLEREGGALPGGLPGYPWWPLLAQVLFVLLRFAGFACCVAAFDLQADLDGAAWLAAFALAWTAGLVVPGAPGGLGVFEAVLLLRLGGMLPEAPVLAVALSYRLVVTLADLVGMLLIDLDARLARRWPTPPVAESSSQ